MKKNLTYNEYLQLEGLCAMANQQYEKLQDTEKAIAELIGDAGDDGFSDPVRDSIYGSNKLIAKRLIMDCKIKIEPKKK